MKKLKYSIAVLIFWLIFLFNIERLAETVDIRSYTYMFVALAAAVTIVIPNLSRGAFSLLLIMPIPIFLVFKTLFESGDWYENLFVGDSLTLAVTQVSAIVITGLLARQISSGLVEFKEIITTLTFGRIGTLPPSLGAEQSVMYNEVRRARRHERPLAVVALKIDKQTIHQALPKMIEEVQQSMMREYALSWLARILDDNLDDLDVIVRHEDNFILLMPETTIEDVPFVVNKLETIVKEKMNVKLQTGIATLPHDGMTFELLIETAVQYANQQVEDKPSAGQPQPQVMSQEI